MSVLALALCLPAAAGACGGGKLVDCLVLDGAVVDLGALAGPDRTATLLAERELSGTDLGSGGDRDAKAILALILGIIPGFGVGHIVADHPGWTTWLIIDIVIVVVWVLAWQLGGPMGLLSFIVTVVERAFEGYFAYSAAMGRYGGPQLVTAPDPPKAPPVLSRVDRLPILWSKHF
jgi:hypothetical protein